MAHGLAPDFQLASVRVEAIAHAFPSHIAVQPPSTAKIAPVMYDDSSDARNSAAYATSCGVPIRPRKVLLICLWCSSEPSGGEMRVLMAPGQMALQRMFWAP